MVRKHGGFIQAGLEPVPLQSSWGETRPDPLGKCTFLETAVKL